MKDFQKILDDAEKLAVDKFNSIPEENYCGTAYIAGIPGTSEIIRFVKKTFKKDNDYTYSKGNIIFRKDVYKGYTVSVYFGSSQSLTRKELAMLEFCVHLQDNGVKCRLVSKAL